ncbi:MAG: DUF86 domain-containing protein [Syntrophomonadaceae bacterium]|nr:DUF86 domain-containing protein [Syntrophomonadaceae bacterium]
MERLKQRLEIAWQALMTLEELSVLKQPSAIERDAAIQRFEYTVEASWKAAKRYLSIVEGIDSGSPKGVIRYLRESGFFSDDEATLALEMIDDRNLTSHTYNKEIAERLFSRIPNYTQLLNVWITRMKTNLKN